MLSLNRFEIDFGLSSYTVPNGTNAFSRIDIYQPIVPNGMGKPIELK
jgi:hypothetical protein